MDLHVTAAEKQTRDHAIQISGIPKLLSTDTDQSTAKCPTECIQGKKIFLTSNLWVSVRPYLFH